MYNYFSGKIIFENEILKMNRVSLDLWMQWFVRSIESNKLYLKNTISKNIKYQLIFETHYSYINCIQMKKQLHTISFKENLRKIHLKTRIIEKVT